MTSATVTNLKKYFFADFSTRSCHSDIHNVLKDFWKPVTIWQMCGHHLYRLFVADSTCAFFSVAVFVTRKFVAFVIHCMHKTAPIWNVTELYLFSLLKAIWPTMQLLGDQVHQCEIPNVWEISPHLQVFQPSSHSLNSRVECHIGRVPTLLLTPVRNFPVPFHSPLMFKCNKNKYLSEQKKINCCMQYLL